MSKILGRPTVELRLTLILEEEEVRALDALIGYGDDEFIKAFYEKLGTAYMEKHEAGLRLLFKSVRDQVPGWLDRADNARREFRKGLTP